MSDETLVGKNKEEALNRKYDRMKLDMGATGRLAASLALPQLLEALPTKKKTRTKKVSDAS